MKKYNLIKKYIFEVSKMIAFDPNEEINKKYTDLNKKDLIDMTHLSTKDTLVKVFNNVSESTYIHFANSYEYKDKKKIAPSLSISGFGGTYEPLGLYAYKFGNKDVKNLFKQITSKKNEKPFSSSSIGLNREYFVLFKLKDNYNKLDIKKNKISNSNYSGNFNKDLNTIIHTFLIYTLQTLENNSKDFKYHLNNYHGLFTKDYFEGKEFTPIRPGAKNFYDKSKIISNLNSGISSVKEINFTTVGILGLDKSLLNNFKSYIYYYVLVSKSLQKIKNDGSNLKITERSFTEEVMLFLKKSLNKIISKNENKNSSKIEMLYLIILILQKIYSQFIDTRTKNDTIIVTILLNSIGIDSVEQIGGGILHMGEQNQAVFTDTNKLEYIGTFKNIFNPRKKEFNEVKEILLRKGKR